ncbi:hypothetical protein [Stenotrophomonas sp. CFBP 13725]|uniref:hypothetical protein n=1 Tax=Stenotrophomonas sp. CFBP 13725 TaxID=2775297 RepID=UPI001785FDF7|nr:hypothetical protein [Stenotrophomonas sp. CFBP 13725]MBD8637247.1 hypothetical protein [Stenotrophomonas sp. CFBP 13725]
MHSMTRALLLSLLLSSSVAAAAPLDPATGLAARMQALDEGSGGQPLAQRIQHLRAVYVSDARVAALDTQSSDLCDTVAASDLDDLFAATWQLNFYAREPALLQRMTCLFQRMKQSGTASAQAARDLYGALVAQRRFAAANALGQSEALKVDELPVVSGERTAGLQVLQLQDALHARLAELPRDGTRVIALVHPYCGFSMDALAAIADDPTLAWLRPQLQVVVPSDNNWPVTRMLEWNAAHPDLPMQPMQPGAAWAPLLTGSTPTFHVLRDGELRASASGWTDDGAALRKLRPVIGEGR